MGKQLLRIAGYATGWIVFGLSVSACGARNFMKTASAYYRVVVARGRTGNGEVETVGLSDPERARLAHKWASRLLLPRSGDSHATLHR